MMKILELLSLSDSEIDAIVAKHIEYLYHNWYGSWVVKIKVDDISYRLMFFDVPPTESIDLCLTLANERPEVWTLTRTTDKRYKFILYPKPRSNESHAWYKHERPEIAIIVTLLKACRFLED